MACRGVLFAIEEKLANQLKSMERKDVVEFIQEEIEEEFFDEKPEYVAELDKSWDAMHRMFSKDENDFTSKEGEYPFNYLIMGSQVIYGDKDEENDYIVTLKTPRQVQDIYQAVNTLNESVFKEKYYAIDETAYGFPLTDEDCANTWEWLKWTIPFWKTASGKELFVIFTVDQ